MPLPRLLLICAALAWACGGAPPFTPQPALERSAIALGELARWELSFGPQPRCRGEYVDLRWDVEPAAVLSERCVTSSALDGCFHYEGECPACVPVITIAAGQARTDEQLAKLRRHEVRHWLLNCSGVAPGGDPEHQGPWWSGL